MFLDFYKTDLQATYALWPVPLLFLAYLILTGGRGRDGDADARFVRVYALVFAAESLLDSFATGPLSRWLGIAGSGAGTAVMVAFVLLGDFRVLLLLLRLARPTLRPLQLAAEAALWTLPVPLVAYGVDSVLQAVAGPLPGQTIWLLYELAFLALALWLRKAALARWVGPGRAPRLAYLRSVATYVAGYYALWVTADVLILILGLDAGWLLRIVPNQLYYSFYVPFVFFRFFASPENASSSTSTHASR